MINIVAPTLIHYPSIHSLIGVAAFCTGTVYIFMVLLYAMLIYIYGYNTHILDLTTSTALSTLLLC